MPSYLCRRLLALLTPCRGRDRERERCGGNEDVVVARNQSQAHRSRLLT